MPEVSTRDFKDGLSAWIRRAEAGERVVVTRSGKPVAALGPLADLPRSDARSVLADLASRGLVRPPTRPAPMLELVGGGSEVASSVLAWPETLDASVDRPALFREGFDPG